LEGLPREWCTLKTGTSSSDDENSGLDECTQPSLNDEKSSTFDGDDVEVDGEEETFLDCRQNEDHHAVQAMGIDRDCLGTTLTIQSYTNPTKFWSTKCITLNAVIVMIAVMVVVYVTSSTVLCRDWPKPSDFDSPLEALRTVSVQEWLQWIQKWREWLKAQSQKLLSCVVDLEVIRDWWKLSTFESLLEALHTVFVQDRIPGIQKWEWLTAQSQTVLSCVVGLVVIPDWTKSVTFECLLEALHTVSVQECIKCIHASMQTD
jgi:hypothetical protein